MINEMERDGNCLYEDMGLVYVEELVMVAGRSKA
jgi:hypothetical protein